MLNQIFRTRMLGQKDADIEFYVSETNSIEKPDKDICELGIVVQNVDLQLDASLSLTELESLIKYLTDCKEFIQKFNQ